jgi:GDP-4-dehydro-6-deoxy-D-mannose reductase
MARSVLVTGAAGFAGSHLVDLLTGGGETVVGWHRPGGRHAPAPGLTWSAVDMLDRAAVRAAVARWKPRTVYHCAGASHVGHSWECVESTFATNVLATHHLLDALAAERLDARVLLVSSAMVYAPSDEPIGEDHALTPANPYGLSKLAMELLGSHEGGVEVVLARAFNHFGPRQHPSFVASGFAQRIADVEAGRSEPVLAVGNLEARRDLTDVRDTVRAYRTILEHGQPGRPYNVCSGRAIEIRELLDRLLSRARVRIAVRVDATHYQPNDIPLIVGDPSRARQELGWEPEIPFDRTLDDLLDYWRRGPTPVAN